MKKLKSGFLWIGIILLAALLLRLPSINHPFAAEESEWYFISNSLNSDFTYTNVNYVSPIWNYPVPSMIYRAASLLFGTSTVLLRSISILIALVNILLTYILGKKLLGERAGLFGAGLMAINTWHLFESAMVEHDGSFLMLFYLMTFLSFIYFEETKKKRWLAISTLGFVLALLSKTSAVLIVGILMLYLFIANKNTALAFKEVKKSWKKAIISAFKGVVPAIKYGAIMGIAGFIVLLAFFFCIKQSSPIYYEALIHRLFEAGKAAEGFSGFSIARLLIYLVLWASPLLLGLTLLSIKQWNKNKSLIFSWFLVPVLAYSTSQYYGGIDRYLSVIIPAMCLLGGAVLANIKLNKKESIILCVAAVLSFGILTWLNGLPSEYLTHSTFEYIRRAISLNWSFLFPFYGASGPNFIVSFIMLGTGVAASSLLFLTTFIWKKKNIFLILFVSIALALNGVLVQDFLYSPQHADPYLVMNELADAYNEANYDGMLYVSNTGLTILLNRFGPEVKTMDVYSDSWEQRKLALEKEGGAILILDFPKLPENDPLKTLAKDCTLVKTIRDKDLSLGYMYRCEATS